MTLIIIAVCLLLSALFSGTETGYMSVSRVRMHSGGDHKSWRGKLLLEQLKQIEEPILTCLVGTNLFNVIGSAALTVALVDRFGQLGQWYAILVGSVLIIVLGEIIPKVIFREYPEDMTMFAVPGIRFFMVVLAPIRFFLRAYSRFWEKMVPAGEDSEVEGLDRTNLAALLLSNSMPRQGDDRFSRTVDSFIDVAALNLGQVMNPIRKLVTVTENTTVSSCLDLARESGFSRLPIADKEGSRLPGYVLVRDLLFLSRDDHQRPVPRKLWRNFLLVDVRMTPFELFEDLRHLEQQVAVVVEPGGNPIGMITLEDLIESVIGSVSDEFDGPLP